MKNNKIPKSRVLQQLANQCLPGYVAASPYAKEIQSLGLRLKQIHLIPASKSYKKLKIKRCSSAIAKSPS